MVGKMTLWTWVYIEVTFTVGEKSVKAVVWVNFYEKYFICNCE